MSANLPPPPHTHTVVSCKNRASAKNRVNNTLCRWVRSVRRTCKYQSSSSGSFPTFYVGSMFLMRRLHLRASSSDNSLSDKSFLMLSNHLRFGLHLVLFPGTAVTMYSSSLLNTCMPIPLQVYFPALSCIIYLTSVVPLILSFLILSSLVTPIIHLSILICTTSNSLTLNLSLRSHRTPDTLSSRFPILIVSASSRIRFLPVQAQPTAARSSRRAVAHGRHIGRYFYLIILPLLIILLSLKWNFIIL